MSLMVSDNSLYLKNPENGEFLPVSIFNSGADKSMEKIAEFAENVKSEASTAMEARKTELVESMQGDADEIKAQIVAGAEVDLEAKKNQVLEQIPDDYSELGANVTQLKDDLIELNSEADKLMNSIPNELKSLIDKVIEIPIYQGGIDYSTGEETTASFGMRLRSEYIELGKNIRVNPNSNVKCVVRVYDGDKAFLGNASAVEYNKVAISTASYSNYFEADLIKDLYPKASFIRIIITKLNVSEAITPEEVNVQFLQFVECLNGSPLDNVYLRKGTYEEYFSDDISLTYDIDDEGHYTKGFLKLPSSYTKEGTKTPVIVFIHGSADFNNLNADTMTNSYNDYYNYLRDCGYAVFDCYGLGNVYTDIVTYGAHTFGSPTNMKCYLKGIKYICETYNLDENNIFISGKSLGGLLGYALCYQDIIPIKACGLLAPQLEVGVVYPLFFTQPLRNAFAIDFGFTGDWQSVLDVSNDDYDHMAAKNYLKTQTDFLSIYSPTWLGCIATTEEKITNSFSLDYNNNGYKICNVPIKIWSAPDDTDAWYASCERQVSILKNGGSKAELRTMPEGTGGHHAVDNDPNALQTTNITTKLGVDYETIPTAYYELAKYFDSFLV